MRQRCSTLSNCEFGVTPKYSPDTKRRDAHCYTSLLSLGRALSHSHSLSLLSLGRGGHQRLARKHQDRAGGTLQEFTGFAC